MVKLIDFFFPFHGPRCTTFPAPWMELPSGISVAVSCPLVHLELGTAKTWCVERSPKQFEVLTIHSGALATFPPTSSPELDNILSNWRQNVFLPNHLKRDLRALMFRPTKHPILLNDELPVTASIPVTHSPEPETVRLRPLDRSQRPVLADDLPRMLALMTAPADLDIIRPFLHEIAFSPEHSLRPQQKTAIARAGARLQRLGLVADLVRHADATGFALGYKRDARDILHVILADVVAQGWTAAALDRAVRNAGAVLASYEHACASGEGLRASTDRRLMPDVYGSMLALEASRAVLYRGRVDEDGAISARARQVLEHWEARQLPSLDFDLRWSGRFVAIWAPTWQGAQMALRVLGEGSPLGSQLRRALDADMQPFISAVLEQYNAADEQVREELAESVKLYDDMAASLHREPGSPDSRPESQLGSRLETQPESQPQTQPEI